jgi:hypothetical protein
MSYFAFYIKFTFLYDLYGGRRLGGFGAGCLEKIPCQYCGISSPGVMENIYVCSPLSREHVKLVMRYDRP